IGELFIEHDVQQHYGVGLLHRHFDLQDNQIMLHRLNAGDIDVCSVCDVHSVDATLLVPHSLYLNSMLTFEPFEYSLGDTRVPHFDTSFLDALRDLLISLALRETISLVPNPSDGMPNGIIVENTLAGIEATQSTVQPREWTPHKGDTAVITGWRFHQDQLGRLQIVEVKECVKNGAGVHNVT
ncbi:hypothetical protein EJ05DRAFT_446719, partial [Pseudovirgaria hyperparasitica]